MHKNLPIVLIIAVALIMGLALSSCTSSKKIARFENFDDFYGKFHSDSIFQLSRVNFPLKGKKIDSSGEQNWSKENWSVLTIPVYDVDTTVFKVRYEHSNMVFSQKSWIENSGFSVEHRFELIKRKWYLVYALEVNL